MTSELIPCPFCGSDQVTAYKMMPGRHYCICSACEADGPIKETEAQAVLAWNLRAPTRTRIPDDALQAILEAARTRATVALLDDGAAMFINYGDQPEDTAHLECPACSGSGHIDDANLPRFPELTEAQQDAIKEVVATELGTTYDCGRVWSAWSVGTMGRDDFMPVVEDYSRLHDITMAAVNGYVSALKWTA